MPMLMLKCKTCGTIFSGVYAEDMNEFRNESEKNPNSTFKCSKGHLNNYVLEDYVDLS
jgi:hypothetical protein